jgi:chromate reductase
MTTYTIVAVSGSLRKASYNSALLRALKERAHEGVNIEILDISGLAVFDQDMEENFPAEVVALKEKIAKADGVILATPEYNRSMSSAMKNFIDWSSRPYGTGPWGGKPVATIGASMAHTGTMLAQAELKTSLLFLGAHVIGQPEFYLGAAHEKIDAEGNITDADTQTHLDSVLVALTTHIDKAR